MSELFFGPCCQSCGIPVTRPEDFGCEANNVKRLDYCARCYFKGKFTEPDATKDMMAERIAGFIAKKNKVPIERARMEAEEYIAGLKRWRVKPAVVEE